MAVSPTSKFSIANIKTIRLTNDKLYYIIFCRKKQDVEEFYNAGN